MTGSVLPHDLPELLTVPEVAAALRLSRPMVFKLLQNGDLEAVRFGKAIRVPAEDVRRLITERRQRGNKRER